jgi:uncharacterized protein YcbX
MICVSSLIHYPIKACRGTETDAFQVLRLELDGDRPMLLITLQGKFLTQREYPRLALVRPRTTGDVKPCARCVVTTIEEQTLAKDRGPLKTLASFRTQPGAAIFRHNVIPLNEGKLEIGMPVEILA